MRRWLTTVKKKKKGTIKKIYTFRAPFEDKIEGVRDAERAENMTEERPFNRVVLRWNGEARVKAAQKAN